MYVSFCSTNIADLFAIEIKKKQQKNNMFFNIIDGIMSKSINIKSSIHF